MLRTPACLCGGHAHAHREGCWAKKPDDAATLARLQAEHDEGQRQHEAMLRGRKLLVSLDEIDEFAREHASVSFAKGLFNLTRQMRKKAREVFPPDPKRTAEGDERE